MRITARDFRHWAETRNWAAQGDLHNEAERALRHWVIARRIMMGMRCDAGLRTFTLLASVIETCRQCGQLPWTYLAGVIADRRAGRTAASLPAPVPGL
jgi:transposase